MAYDIGKDYGEAIERLLGELSLDSLEPGSVSEELERVLTEAKRIFGGYLEKNDKRAAYAFLDSVLDTLPDPEKALLTGIVGGWPELTGAALWKIYEEHRSDEKAVEQLLKSATERALQLGPDSVKALLEGMVWSITPDTVEKEYRHYPWILKKVASHLGEALAESLREQDRRQELAALLEEWYSRAERIKGDVERFKHARNDSVRRAHERRHAILVEVFRGLAGKLPRALNPPNLSSEEAKDLLELMRGSVLGKIAEGEFPATYDTLRWREEIVNPFRETLAALEFKAGGSSAEALLGE